MRKRWPSVAGGSAGSFWRSRLPACSCGARRCSRSMWRPPSPPHSDFADTLRGATVGIDRSDRVRSRSGIAQFEADVPRRFGSWTGGSARQQCAPSVAFTASRSRSGARRGDEIVTETVSSTRTRLVRPAARTGGERRLRGRRRSQAPPVPARGEHPSSLPSGAAYAHAR